MQLAIAVKWFAARIVYGQSDPDCLQDDIALTNSTWIWRRAARASNGPAKPCGESVRSSISRVPSATFSNWQPSELATFVRKPASAFRTNGNRFALLLLGTISGRSQNETGLARRPLNDALVLLILEPGLLGLDGILTGRLVASPSCAMVARWPQATSTMPMCI